MERMKHLAERIAGLALDKVKSVLWLLSYNPDEVLNVYGNDIDPIKFQEAIVEARMAKDENFVFGSKEAKMNLYGVEKLKKYNPVVRDTIIEHCLAIADDPIILRTCILNICTKLGNFEYKERRREAFDVLGFSEQVQSFLEKEIDTYCIGQLLKSIQAERYPKRTFSSDAGEYRGIYMNRAKGECSKKNSQLDLETLMENQGVVQNYIGFYTKLLELGIDPEQVGQKREAVEKIYENAAGLCG